MRISHDLLAGKVCKFVGKPAPLLLFSEEGRGSSFLGEVAEVIVLAEGRGLWDGAPIMKRISLAKTALVASLSLFVLNSPALAGGCANGKCGGGGGITTKKGAASQLPVVSSVDEFSITVGEKNFMLSNFVKVVVNGKKATIEDVKPGMQVMVTGKRVVAGKTQAESIYSASRIVARDNKNGGKEDSGSRSDS